jgi:TATA-box binding protein (TBP) (component of TFIID and TFIIIB)
MATDAFVTSVYGHVDAFLGGMVDGMTLTASRCTRSRLAGPSVAAITLTVDLPSTLVAVPIDLEALAAHVDVMPPAERLLQPKATKKHRFMNCLVYSVPVDGKMKCVKVFRNGVLHLTGAQTADHVRHIVHATVSTIVQAEHRVPPQPLPARVPLDELDLEWGYGDKEEDDETASDEAVERSADNAVKVRMLNCYFSLGTHVDLHMFRDLLISEYNVPAVHDRLKHPGLKFKVPRGHLTAVAPEPDAAAKPTTTVIVFISGKVLLSGSCTESMVDDAHAFVTRVMEEHHDRLKAPAPLGKRKSQDTQGGEPQKRRRGRKPKGNQADLYNALKAKLRL